MITENANYDTCEAMRKQYCLNMEKIKGYKRETFKENHMLMVLKRHVCDIPLGLGSLSVSLSPRKTNS